MAKKKQQKLGGKNYIRYKILDLYSYNMNHRKYDKTESYENQYYI